MLETHSCAMPRPLVPADDPVPALKRQLGTEIAPLLRDWNADDVAAWIGTDRARISERRRGKLTRFSIETLIRYLSRLGCTIEVRVTIRPRFREGARPPHEPETGGRS